MDSRITDEETLKKLEEESRFIEQLFNLSESPILNNPIINTVSNNTETQNEEIEEDVDLVLNRHGEYVAYDSSMVFIEHRNYYVDEDEVYWLEFQNIDEDEDRVIQVLDFDGNEINVSDDYEGLVYVVDDVIFISTAAAINNNYFFDNTGVWLKKIISIDNNINKEELFFYKDIETSLNMFYPNNWWFQKTNYTFDYSKEEYKSNRNFTQFSGYDYLLIIKFPSLNITNADNLKHNIKDLYIVLPFNKLGRTKAAIFGFRGKINSIEYNNNYYHSHLSCTNEYQINQFCLGSGPLVDILANMYNKDFNKDLFTFFLANLRIYVEWESLEGVPYRYIKNLLNKKIITISKNNLYKDYNIHFDRALPLLNIDLEYNNIDKLLDLNFKKLELELSKVFENTGNFNFVYKDEDLDQYFDIGNTSNTKVPSLKLPLCKLGDEDIYLQYESIENKNTNFKKVIHPNYTYYAKEYYSRRINEFYFKENKNRLS